MCVRYTLHKVDAALSAISQALGVRLDVPDWALPRYNVAPTDAEPVVARTEGRTQVRPMRWGLIPAPERGKPRPRLLMNARGETALALPAFRKAAAARRCLVPANGFYEWQAAGDARLPHLFTLRGEEPFALAGIWDPSGEGWPETFCVLTTEPNPLVARIHDRMPVILTAETMPRWLGDRPLDNDEFAALVRPLDQGLMQSRPVSRFVNSTRNQGPECLAPPEAHPPQGELDFG